MPDPGQGKERKSCCHPHLTVCPWCLDPIYIVTFCMKSVKASWTDSMYSWDFIYYLSYHQPEQEKRVPDFFYVVFCTLLKKSADISNLTLRSFSQILFFSPMFYKPNIFRRVNCNNFWHTQIYTFIFTCKVYGKLNVTNYYRVQLLQFVVYRQAPACILPF